jgi:NAD-dependent deacetylase
LTGAGLSAESGLATFRDAKNGLWARYDPMTLATPEAFAANPALVHEFYDVRREGVQQVEPNGAHHALARLQTGLRARGDEAILCTQNVDDLLERAGAPDVMHMHGSLLQARCVACRAILRWLGPMGVSAVCPACEVPGRLRPHVVWFGERPLHLETIDVEMNRATLFVAIGTSGTVYPAAGFVDMAQAAGVPTMELNLEPSARAGAFDGVILGPASETVPAWVDSVLLA